MWPDKNGYFGAYGGKFIPEILLPAVCELEKAYHEAKESRDFQEELSSYLKEYSGRPTPLTFAERLSQELGGAKIYLKREDLNHTGAHTAVATGTSFCAVTFKVTVTVFPSTVPSFTL